MVYLQIDKLFSTFLKEKQYLQGASPATVRSYSKAWLAYKHYVGCTCRHNPKTRWMDVGQAAPVAAEPTAYEQVLAIFNGKPLKTGEVKKLLPKLSPRAVDQALKLAVENKTLLNPAFGTYQKPDQKPAENPNSATSQPPIGECEVAKFTEPVEDIVDNSLFDEQLENDDCEVRDGDVGADDDGYLDAIDR